MAQIRQVNLEAWGQNAHFYRDKEITADEIWNNDLPYVILGSLTIDANKNLLLIKVAAFMYMLMLR